MLKSDSIITNLGYWFQDCCIEDKRKQRGNLDLENVIFCNIFFIVEENGQKVRVLVKRRGSHKRYRR